MPKALADLIQVTLQIRRYDLVPDVMVYSNRFPAGFPNGRRLKDDVVAQVCATGDCLLQELSYIEAKPGVWPRATVNDKPLPSEWPMLAEQWPDMQEAPPPTESIWPYVIGALIAVALVSWVVVEIIRRLILLLWRLVRPRPKPALTA